MISSCYPYIDITIHHKFAGNFTAPDKANIVTIKHFQCSCHSNYLYYNGVNHQNKCPTFKFGIQFYRFIGANLNIDC